MLYILLKSANDEIFSIHVFDLIYYSLGIFRQGTNQLFFVQERFSFFYIDHLSYNSFSSIIEIRFNKLQISLFNDYWHI
jgi:hypothetical protein